MSDDEPEPSDSSRYTHEQKIVAAVWVHEKEYNNQTWKDINSNFLARFSTPPPNRTTFLSWERKLFSTGNVEDREKCGRPLSRLMHVPYVRASLKENPDLSLRERSKLLGLPRTTLLKIIRDDLNMEFEVEEDGTSNLKKRHAPYGGGKWKKKNCGESSGIQQLQVLPEMSGFDLFESDKNKGECNETGGLKEGKKQSQNVMENNLFHR